MATKKKGKVDIVYGEDLPYWETSRSQLNTWLGRVKKLLDNPDIKSKYVAFAMAEMASCEGGYMIDFEIQGRLYRIKWPILPSRNGKEGSASIQAITMMHHDIKSRIVTAQVLGPENAFLSYMLLDGNRTVGDIVSNGGNLAATLPPLLAAPTKSTDDNIVEGEIV